MITLKKIFYLVFLSVFVNFVDAQEYKFRHLTTKEGLLHNTITSIVQDSKGFLWIGTFGGLHRYDGTNVKVFTNSRSDSTSISSNVINTIFEDRDKNIWVGCYKGGLNRYNINIEKFEHIPFPKEYENFDEFFESIHSITQDTSGLMWIANEIGIFSYNPNEKVIVDAFTDLIDRKSITDIFLPSELTITTDNKILFCYNGSLFQIDADTKILTKLDQINVGYIGKIVLGPMGEYWLSSQNSVFQYSPDKGILKSYTLERKNTQSMITSLLVCDSLIWVGSYDDGLYIINRKTGKQARITQNINNPFSLCSDNLRITFKDKYNIVWIGTTEGISSYYPNMNNFNSVLLDEKLNKLNDNVTVTSIAFDNEGNRWYGTLNNGLIKYNPKLKEYKQFVHDSKNPNSLLGNRINSLCFDNEGNLFIAVGYGLSIYNAIQNRFWNYSKFNAKSYIPAFLLQGFTKDSKGIIWSGSWSSGLFNFDFKDKKLKYKQYVPDMENQLSFSGVNTTSVVEDKNGSIWAGTIGGGLNKYERQSDSGLLGFTHYKYNRNNSSTIPDNDILTLFVDSQNNIWIGTANKGIAVFNQNDSSLSNYTINEGLISNVIYSIAEDEFKNIWISTNKGLSKINVSNNSIVNFTESDGLLVSDFISNSFAKNNYGIFVYGGKRGITSFKPSTIKMLNYNPIVYFTDLEINGEKVKVGEEIDGEIVLEKSILQSDSVLLSHNTGVLTLELASIQYLSTSNNVYQYKLEGFDDDWRITDAQQYKITYTNLDPGKYVLHVKNIFNDESAKTEIRSLNIIITPPYYKTWWFIIFMFLLAAALIFIVFNIRTERIKRYARELEEKVDNRTKEIKMVNENLQKVNSELSEFAYIVSHDLKAPLRGIGQLATWIVQDSAKYLDKNGKENLNMLISRVARMNGLIEGMLQYSRAGKVTIDLVKIDLNRTVNDIVEFLLLPQNVKIKIEKDLPVILGEKFKVEQAIQNIINNAVTYCDKEVCEINIKSEVSDIYDSLIFEDNGPGINYKYHKKIFGVFQTLGSKEESIGIGLSVVKKIMQGHGGKVNIISPLKDNYGTAFILSFKKSGKDD